MIILDTTTKTIEFKLSVGVVTNHLDYSVHWVQYSSTFMLNAISSGTGVSNQTTRVIAVTAPASGEMRQLKYFTLYNKDTAAAEITFYLNNNGTLVILAKETIQPGETFEYVS